MKLIHATLLALAAVILFFLPGCGSIDGKSPSPVPGDIKGTPSSPKEIQEQFKEWTAQRLKDAASDEAKYKADLSAVEAKWVDKIGDSVTSEIEAIKGRVEGSIKAAAEEGQLIQDILGLARDTTSVFGGPVGVAGGVATGVLSTVAAWFFGRRNGQTPAIEIASSIEQLKKMSPDIERVFGDPRVRDLLRTAQGYTARRIVDRVQSRLDKEIT